MRHCVRLFDGIASTYPAFKPSIGVQVLDSQFQPEVVLVPAGALRHVQVWRMRLNDRKRGWLAAGIVSGTALVAALLAQPATIQLLANSASN